MSALDYSSFKTNVYGSALACTPTANQEFWNRSCVDKCAGTTVRNATSGTCQECWEIDSNKPSYRNGTCTTCATGTRWNSESHTCEPIVCGDNKVLVGNDCKLCTEIDAVNKPYYNTETKTCEACPATLPWNNNGVCTACTGETPYYNPSSKVCEACPATLPWNNNGVCTACTGETPNFNTVTKQCAAACGEGKAWDTTGNTCVVSANATCKDNYYNAGSGCVSCHSVNSAKPYYNSVTKVCEACPSATPNFNTVTEVCQESTCNENQTWDMNTNKCVDNEPESIQCGEGEHLDLATGECATCEEGTTWDTAQQLCVQTTTESSSNTGLYIGIGAGALVAIGIIVFMVMKK